MDTQTETWIIRHKETKDAWKARSGKASWNKPGHAKLAWTSTARRWDYHHLSLRFDDQDEYEIVQLKSDWKDKYEALVSYMKSRINEYDLGDGDCLKGDIEEFIAEQESE